MSYCYFSTFIFAPIAMVFFSLSLSFPFTTIASQLKLHTFHFVQNVFISRSLRILPSTHSIFQLFYPGNHKKIIIFIFSPSTRFNFNFGHWNMMQLYEKAGQRLGGAFQKLFAVRWNRCCIRNWFCLLSLRKCNFRIFMQWQNHIFAILNANRYFRSCYNTIWNRATYMYG